MAIKARTPGKTFKHVLSSDVRPARIEPTPENPEPDNSAHDDFKATKFELRVLDSGVIGALKDKSTKITIDPNNPDGEIGTQVNQNQLYFEVCQFGIAGVENYDAPYKDMPRNFLGRSFRIATAEFVGTIGDTDIAELAERILAGNSVSAEEGNASA